MFQRIQGGHELTGFKYYIFVQFKGFAPEDTLSTISKTLGSLLSQEMTWVNISSLYNSRMTSHFQEQENSYVMPKMSL